jgi:hypothetical protein
MKILIMLLIIPVYIVTFIKNCVSRIIYKYEKISKNNINDIENIFTILLQNIGMIDQQNLRIKIKENRITKLKVYKIIFYNK